jgi:hypothetical protein
MMRWVDGRQGSRIHPGDGPWAREQLGAKGDDRQEAMTKHLRITHVQEGFVCLQE